MRSVDDWLVHFQMKLCRIFNRIFNVSQILLMWLFKFLILCFQTGFRYQLCLAYSWEVFRKTKIHSKARDSCHVFDFWVGVCQNRSSYSKHQPLFWKPKPKKAKINEKSKKKNEEELKKRKTWGKLEHWPKCWHLGLWLRQQRDCCLQFRTSSGHLHRFAVTSH